MVFIGIILGLIAATTQSMSYIFARKFSAGRTSSQPRLLVASHIVMGVAGLIALPFVWPTGIDWSWAWGRPVILCTVFYLVGQGMMFVALHSAEASKISPLLALKVVMLAFLTWGMMGTVLNFLQWVGVALCLCGTFMLNWGGGGIARRAIVAILLACLFYSLSDMNITIMVRCLEGRLTRWNAVFFGVCASYILCGLICAPLIFFVKNFQRGDFRDSFGFAFFWLTAMVFLFATFSITGTVFGNILQSTRGIISIILGAIIAAMGHHHIEGHTTRAVFIRRLIAGVIMTAAVIAYAYGDLMRHAS